MSNKQGVNPTKQHSMKCPKLHGKKCKCDGDHTFDELYNHRIALFITLCNFLYSRYRNEDKMPWKSRKHFDGTMFDGWFLAGIGYKKGEQITYHLPIKYWDRLRVLAYDTATTEWDGHTSDDVIERLLKL